MIESFNKKSFSEKLEIFRDNKDVVKLEYDNGWTWVEFVDMPEEIKEEIEGENWFNWDGEAFTDSSAMYDLMTMAGII